MINDQSTIQKLRASFGFLQTAEPGFERRFLDAATLVHLPSGAPVCSEGDACGHLALVIQGNARVYKLGENGREITLYRIASGESCVLTASCILSKRPFPAFALCETEIEAVVVPAPSVERWLVESTDWRDYVFGLLAQRLGNIIDVVEEVAFKRMDRRIAAYLHQNCPAGQQALHSTHQQIASDLGTSREVVSRILKDFECEQLIRVGRGNIELLRRLELERKARDV